ncbi:hypothetical protein ILYODFUR_016374 [Ilyodon furcidens]|uniref:Uncharacterized protein n=1 Tax=Ilyodon furcidens TaxID=33524 RepID=A0ABV0TWR1_9TELE
MCSVHWLCPGITQFSSLKPVIFFIPDCTSLILFCWSLLSSFSLSTSLLSLFLTLSYFCKLLNNSLSLLKGSFFFLVKQVLQATCNPGFVTEIASHQSGEDSVIHTEVYIISHTLSHGIDVISMLLSQCIPVL